MAADDLQSKAADLVRKALTVSVGAIFLTEESLRALVSEFKLPKELLAGILESANKAKNDFLQNLSRDVIGRIQDRVDPKALIEEILRNNELDFHMKVRLKPRRREGAAGHKKRGGAHASSGHVASDSGEAADSSSEHDTDESTTD